MSQHFHIVFRNNATGEEIARDFGPFPPDDWGPVEAFGRYTHELEQTSIASQWGRYSVTLHTERGHPMTVPSQSPTHEEVWLFLHKFRPIYLAREPTNFHRICNLLNKHFDHLAFRDFIRIRKNEYGCKKITAGMAIRAGKWVINSDEFLDHYLNAHEYHKDQDKQRDIEEIRKVFPDEAQWAILCMLLICKAYAAKDVGRFVRILIERQDGRAIKLTKP